MREHIIIEQAQREVAARRAAAIEQRSCGWKRRLLPLLALALVIAVAAAPGALSRKLLWLMGGVCNLRPAHSYFAGSTQLPLEARMLGIYGGLLLSGLLLLVRGRWGAQRMSRPLVLLLAMLFGTMVFDGVNSTLMELGGPHPYTTTNPIRLVTGLLAGTALAPVLLWLLSSVLLPRRPVDGRAALAGLSDVALLLLANASLGLLITTEHAWLYLPVALLGVSGVVVTLAAVLLLPIITLSGAARRVTHPRRLLAPASLALMIALALLAGLAAVRWLASGPAI